MDPRLLLSISYDLGELPDRRSYLRGARERLGELLPCDDVWWIEVDFSVSSAFVMHGRPFYEDPEFAQALALTDDHPGISSYLSYPLHRSLRRISDVFTPEEWQRSKAASALCSALGDYQLSLVVNLCASRRGSCWILTRDNRDFEDGELETAWQLLPVLTLLDRLYLGRGIDKCLPDISAADPLTAREADILTLVSYGLTADAIGRLRRISVKTVRKHLENIYRELDCHDRLMAVDRARQLGVIPTGDPSPLALHR